MGKVVKGKRYLQVKDKKYKTVLSKSNIVNRCMAPEQGHAWVAVRRSPLRRRSHFNR